MTLTMKLWKKSVGIGLFGVALFFQCSCGLGKGPFLKKQVERPEILPTSAWKGVLPSGSFQSQIPDRLTLLHSGIFIPELPETLSIIKIQQEKDIHRGWGDLGCHFYMDPHGVIYQSRRLSMKGRALEEEQGFDTTSHILVMLMGDYNRQAPAEDFQENFIALIGWILQHYEVPRESFKGLNEYLETDSPGRLLTEWIESDEFQERFDEYMGIQPEEKTENQPEKIRYSPEQFTR